MKLPPITLEEALEYSAKTSRLADDVVDLMAPVENNADLFGTIMSARENLAFQLAALHVVHHKLVEAEDALVALLENNAQLTALLQQFLDAHAEGDEAPAPETSYYAKPVHLDPEEEVFGVMEPTGPSGRPAMYDPDRDQWYELDREGFWQSYIPESSPTTVEFRTHADTYDANKPEIHRVLAEEIVRTFGMDPSHQPTDFELTQLQEVVEADFATLSDEETATYELGVQTKDEK